MLKNREEYINELIVKIKNLSDSQLLELLNLINQQLLEKDEDDSLN